MPTGATAAFLLVRPLFELTFYVGEGHENEPGYALVVGGIERGARRVVVPLRRALAAGGGVYTFRLDPARFPHEVNAFWRTPSSSVHVFGPAFLSSLVAELASGSA